MNALINLVAGAAAELHNRRLRGENRAWLTRINPDTSLFLIGSNFPETDERIRERVLYGKIEQVLEDPVLGGIVLCPDDRTFRTLYDRYGGDPGILFFGENASYDYMAGVAQDSVEQGMRELIGFYRSVNQGAPQNMESILDLLLRHLTIGSYEELRLCVQNLQDSMSVSEFMNREELRRGFAVPYGFEMLLNNHWENDIPAFMTFIYHLELDLRKARAQNAPMWSFAQTVADHRIAVFRTTVNDQYLKMAICTEMFWLNRMGYPYDWIVNRAGLPKTMSERLLAGMTDQQTFCLISSTIAECGLEIEWLAEPRPVIVCLGATGKDAETLSQFYNAAYRETNVNIHMHHGIGAGFGHAMMPGMEPALLTPHRIYRGGAVILEPGRYTVCSYLLT